MQNRSTISGHAILFSSLLFAVMVLAGCSKPSEPASPLETTGGRQRGNAGGGPGGPGGGKRGRSEPVAESASGTEIYQAKCNCHGTEGKGGRAPVLTGGAGHSETELTSIIGSGKGRMPAFNGQLSEAQIKKVVAYVKDLK